MRAHSTRSIPWAMTDMPGTLLPESRQGNQARHVIGKMYEFEGWWDSLAPEDMAALRLTMAPMAPHRASLKEITGKQALTHANFGSVDVGRFRRYT